MLAAEVASRRNSIGVLRLLLAAMVVYSHSYYLGRFETEPLLRWTDGRMFLGLLAVQGFFCISGFLVTRSFLYRPSFVIYAWHRILRLAPAFWVCLVVTAFAFTPLLHLMRPGELPVESMVGYVLNNLFSPRAQVAIGAYPQTWNLDWNGSLWTLRYEFACYAMIAAVGVCGLLVGRLKWIFVGGVFFGVAAFFLRQGLGIGPKEMPIDRLFDTPGKLLTWHFLVASVLALFPAIVQVVKGSWVIGISSLVLVVASWHGPAWLSPLALPPAVLWLAYWIPAHRFETTVGGDYSYGLYLYGYPIQEMLLVIGAHQYGVAFFFVAAMLLGLSCAFVSWHVIEKNALSLK